MCRDQDRKARHELCTKNLTDQDVIVQPIGDALWIELGVFRVSDVEHLLPRNEDVLEDRGGVERSEEHTSELQSLMRLSYAVFCLKKKTITYTHSFFSFILSLFMYIVEI